MNLQSLAVKSCQELSSISLKGYDRSGGDSFTTLPRGTQKKFWAELEEPSYFLSRSEWKEISWKNSNWFCTMFKANKKLGKSFFLASHGSLWLINTKTFEKRTKKLINLNFVRTFLGFCNFFHIPSTEDDSEIHV